MLFPYVRGTNKKYGTDENGGFWGENGYNCIEAGYLQLSDDGKEIKEVIELIPCADVVSIGSILQTPISSLVTFDCIGDGYLRFFIRGKEHLKWESETIPLSDMKLVIGEPMEVKS